MTTSEECRAIPVELQDRLGYLLNSATTKATSIFNKALRPLGIDSREARLLFLTSKNPDISQLALGEKASIHRNVVIRLIDSLEKKGLVRRVQNPEDRRAYFIHLTDKGNTVAKESERIGRSAQNQLLRGFSEKERNNLVSCLCKFLDQ